MNFNGPLVQWQNASFATKRPAFDSRRVHQFQWAGSDSGSTAALHAASQGSTPCRSTSLRQWPCGVEVSTALFHGADSGALPDKAAIYASIAQLAEQQILAA